MRGKCSMSKHLHLFYCLLLTHAFYAADDHYSKKQTVTNPTRRSQLYKWSNGTTFILKPGETIEEPKHLTIKLMPIDPHVFIKKYCIKNRYVKKQ